MDPTGIDRPENLSGIEHLLGRLGPAPVAIDRDRLLFEAGRAAGRAETRQVGLRVACAALALVTVGLAGLSWTQHRALRDAVVAESRSQDNPSTVILADRRSPPDPTSYIALRQNPDAPIASIPPGVQGSARIPSAEPGTLTVRDAARVLDF